MNRRKNGGFSLIEILIVMAILTFGISATAFFSRTITQTNLFSRQHDDAVHLARSRMEQLRHFRDRTGYDAILSGSSTVTSPSAAYTLTWTVVTTTTPPYKAVKMQNSWADADGVTRSVTLDSVIAWFDPLNMAGIL